ncbi:hypothetical protein [Botrimarina sp.]|uniref:hypothetical protein n=1 Tax=Botrimarina sp. TaxID=2795802 RepID=UPI0032EEFAAB
MRWLLVSVALAAAGVCHAGWPEPRPIDAGRLAAAGLRVVEAEQATLVTDAPPSAETDRLPGLIALAAPRWAERFGVARSAAKKWRLRVYLIEDEARFRALGLWPDQSPDFQHGLSLGYEVWVRQQESDYYRRHLLLHEATHSFMATRLGSCGPGWYMEAMAELCGTHQYNEATGELRIASPPETREAAPDWGRVRLVRDAVASGRLLSVDAVRKIDNRRLLATEEYAWVWALASFLDGHPAYRERFARLPGWVNEPDFDSRFDRLYQRDRRRLEQEWRLYAATLCYGHDLPREAIDFRQGEPLAADGSAAATIAADRGWQSSGVAVEAGEPVQITAEGRYVIAHEPDGAPWPCEPGGVTLAYHAGRPLGELLATVDAGPGAFVDAAPVGRSAAYTAPASGTLYLRVNDAANALAENEGSLSAALRRGGGPAGRGARQSRVDR